MSAPSYTTLDGAVTATAPSLYLTSASGVDVGTILFCGREAMRVHAINGTKCEVQRGWGGTLVGPHVTATRIYYGAPDLYHAVDPGAAGDAADTTKSPWINLTTGVIWTYDNGLTWQPSTITDITTDVIALQLGVTNIEEGTGDPIPIAGGGTGAASFAAAKLPMAVQANYIKTTSGAQTVLADATGARVVLIVAVVSQVFANGDGAQPTFAIGETDSTTKFAPTSDWTDAALGTSKIYIGTLTSTKALLVTATAATGTTSTGALHVSAFVMPAA